MTAGGGAIRAFVAVGISAAAREQLAGAAGRIRERIPDGIQWANPDGMHLTLKFMGNIPASAVAPLLDVLAPAAAERRPLGLELAGLGAFPHRRRPRVLWAGVGGDLEALAGLQAAADGAIAGLGYPPETRRFAPHITLGRPRRGLSDAQLSRIGAAVYGVAPPLPAGWRVTSVELMRSELLPSGARYTMLGTAVLGGAAGAD